MNLKKKKYLYLTQLPKGVPKNKRLKVWWPHATLFYFYFSTYDTLQNMVHAVGSHHIVLYMMRRAFVSGIAGIIRITSHSCDEAGAGWVLA